MREPRISMLMTVFNGLPYLRDAVESVLASEGVDFELVVVDNVSSDGSREYLRGIEDPRLNLIENETNLGQTRALNVGLQACLGAYVARLDADDMTEPDRMALQAAYLDAHPDTGLVGGQMLRIKADGSPMSKTALPIDPDMLNARMIVANCFDHSSVSFRRDAALEVGGYPEEHAVSQDFAFFSKIMRAGWRVANIPNQVARVREHENQVMAGPAAKGERIESGRVVAKNLSWAADRSVDEAAGRYLYKVWSGAEFDQDPAEEIEPRDILAGIFGPSRLSSRQKALLAVFLLGGAMSNTRGIRGYLIGQIARNDFNVFFSTEMIKRCVRAAIS